MKKLAALALGLAVAACTPAEPVALTADQDGGLATALAGRSAGPPVDCVNMRDLGSNRSFGEAVVLFGGNTAGTAYVNRPAAGCPNLNGRTLVVRGSSTRLCRGDIASVVDPVSGTNFGSCSLGEFTPYSR